MAMVKRKPNLSWLVRILYMLGNVYWLVPVAPTQRKYAKAWRMHKANKQTEQPEDKKEEKEGITR